MRRSNSKQEILNIAKQMFLEKGYKDTSLRKIVKLAGVTTGAFYSHFKDKEELFKFLVQPAIDNLEYLYKDALSLYDGTIDEPKVLQDILWEQSKIRMSNHIDDIFNNYDAFKLLFTCSDGTQYSRYIHDNINISVKKTKNYFDNLKSKGIKIKDISDQELEILIHTHYLSIYEIVKRDMTYKDAKHYTNTISDFFSAGWIKVLDFQ